MFQLKKKNWKYWFVCKGEGRLTKIKLFYNKQFLPEIGIVEVCIIIVDINI